MNKDESKTIKYYNENAQDWAKGHEVQNYWDKALSLLSNYVPSGRLIEIGAGGGRDATFIIKKGYEYLGIDISDGLLNIARSKNPGAIFLKKSVLELDLDEKFDVFWSTAVLLHIPKSKIDLALQKIRYVLKDNAYGFISIKQGEGENIQVEEKGERLFVYYSLEEFTKVLNRNGFEVVWYEVEPTNGKTVWLKFIVKKLPES